MSRAQSVRSRLWHGLSAEQAVQSDPVRLDAWAYGRRFFALHIALFATTLSRSDGGSSDAYEQVRTGTALNNACINARITTVTTIGRISTITVVATLVFTPCRSFRRTVSNTVNRTGRNISVGVSRSTAPHATLIIAEDTTQRHVQVDLQRASLLDARRIASNTSNFIGNHMENVACRITSRAAS
jgi:hypothetical protein